MGEALRPPPTRRSSSSSERTMPPPVPPRVNAGRTMKGRPISSSAACASAMLWAIRERGTLRPALVIVSRNSSRSSARAIAS